jgi:cell division protein FtsL
MRGLTSFLLPRMSKVHKILIETALIIIVILLARLIIHKEKVFTTVTKIQLLREDPELTKRKSEDLEKDMTSEEKNQDYMLNNHNHSTK